MDYLNRIERVLERIELAAQRVGRNSADIKLMAVSKLHTADAVVKVANALNALGRPALFGENYVQEFFGKFPEIRAILAGTSGGLEIPRGWEVHFIGHLQSNKAARAVELFDVIQSVDRASLITSIANAAKKARKLQKIMLQINISDDPQKGGLREGELQQVLDILAKFKSELMLVGLMTITAQYDHAEMARGDFKNMFKIAEALRDSFLVKSDNREMVNQRSFELSMGMSQDLEVAIEEGATLVRVGTDIFGPRS